MPNWCDMDLVITNYNLKGTTQDIEKILNKLKNEVRSNEEDIDANNIIPMPKEIWEISSGSFTSACFFAWYGEDFRWDGENHKRKQEELLLKYGKIAKITADKMKNNLDKYGAVDWYDWANMYWGTKWGIVDSKLEYDGPLKKEYNLFSAWGPPALIFDKLSSDYPGLRFKLDVYESGSAIYELIEWYDGVRQINESQEYTGPRGG